MFNSEKKILISKFFKAYRVDYAENVKLEYDTKTGSSDYIEVQADHRIKLYEDIQRK